MLDLGERAVLTFQYITASKKKKNASPNINRDAFLYLFIKRYPNISLDCKLLPICRLFLYASHRKLYHFLTITVFASFSPMCNAYSNKHQQMLSQ